MPAPDARGAIEQALRVYWENRYRAYLADEDDEETFLGAYRINRRNAELPEPVRSAVAYYMSTVETKDLGGVQLHKMPIADESIYIVHVFTDGDDGWLELYDEQGMELGVGRTYIELVGWGDRETIRAQVDTGDFPESLEDRYERTLWGNE